MCIVDKIKQTTVFHVKKVIIGIIDTDFAILGWGGEQSMGGQRWLPWGNLTSPWKIRTGRISKSLNWMWSFSMTDYHKANPTKSSCFLVTFYSFSIQPFWIPMNHGDKARSYWDSQNLLRSPGCEEYFSIGERIGSREPVTRWFHMTGPIAIDCHPREALQLRVPSWGCGRHFATRSRQHGAEYGGWTAVVSWSPPVLGRNHQGECHFKMGMVMGMVLPSAPKSLREFVWTKNKHSSCRTGR